MALVDWHLIHINSIDGSTTFSLEELNSDISLQGLLIQSIIKRILTIPGTDATYPHIGSNIGSLFGTMSAEEADQVTTMFPIFLKSIEEEVLEEQVLLGIDLEPEERLQALKLKSVIYDQAALGWVVTISIITEANAEYIIQL